MCRTNFIHFGRLDVVTKKIKSIGAFALTAVISSVISLAVGIPWGAGLQEVEEEFEKWKRTEFYSLGEHTGVGKPGPIFENAKAEGYQITFKPPTLQDVTVCEYFYDQGPSWWYLALNYLKEYQNCFIVRKISKTEIEVRPDERSISLLQHTDKSDTYWCKCPSEVTGISQQ